MNVIRLIAALVLMSLSFNTTAQQSQAVGDEAVLRQLNAQERAEYQQRLNQAGGERERQEINAQYRNKIQQQAGSQGAAEQAQKQSGASNGPAHAGPTTTRSGPSGSHNKPQKQGR